MLFNKENGDVKKLVVVLIAIALITFGTGSIILFSSKNNSENPNSSVVKNTSSSTISAGNVEKSSQTNIGSSNNSYVDITINEEKVLTLSNIKEIFIDCSIGKVNVIPEARNDIRATYKGTISVPSSYSAPKLEMSIEGTTMNVTAKSKTNEISFKPKKVNLALDVYIPSTYSDNLKLYSSMGDVSINKFNLKAFICKLSMGNSTMSNIKTDNFDYTNSMGNFNCDSLFTKSSNINCSMGDIKLKNFTGDLVSKNSMGNIDINYSEFNNKVDLDASMGKITLTLPEKSEFYLSAKCNMGKITCDFPITTSEKHKENILTGTVKSDKNKITINNSMGEIKVLK